MNESFVRIVSTRRGDDGTVYHPHPNGGGLVAETSYAPSLFHVPGMVIIGPHTRLLSDDLFGQTFVYGNREHFRHLSRVMTDDDRCLLEAQRFWRMYIRVLTLAVAYHVQRMDLAEAKIERRREHLLWGLWYDIAKPLAHGETPPAALYLLNL